MDVEMLDSEYKSEMWQLEIFDSENKVQIELYPPQETYPEKILHSNV